MLVAHFLRMVPSSALRRVGGAHQLAQIGDGIFFFERQDDDRAARHEVGQRAEERAAGMHGVELLGLMLGDFQHLHGEDAEAVFLELLDDVADGVFADGVGFDDGESALQSFHGWSLVLGR